MAGWTDYADWTSAATLKLIASYDLLYPIVAAFNERLDFAKRRKEFVYENRYNNLANIDFKKLDVVSKELLNSISDKVFKLGMHYISPDYNVILTGLTNGSGDRLSKLKSLSLLGEADQFAVMALDAEIPAAWAFQMYRVLNLYRYIPTQNLTDSLFHVYSATSRGQMISSLDISAWKALPITESSYTYTPLDEVLQYAISGISVYSDWFWHNYALSASSVKVSLQPIFNTKFYYAKQVDDTRDPHDYWHLGDNRGALLADCTEAADAEIIVPYPDLDVFPATLDEIYPYGGNSWGVFTYKSAVYSYIQIDGRSGENGFEFAAGS